MGSASSAELISGVLDIQKILASTSPRSIEDPAWVELVNKNINPRFWTEDYMRDVVAFDTSVQSQVTSPLLALNDSTGNLRTLLRFTARLLYYHRTNPGGHPAPCRPVALIALIVLMTHVIKGFQEKLSVAELFFHLDQAPLAKQENDRLFLHYWGNTVSMELVPGVNGYTLLNHTAQSFLSNVTAPCEFRRIDAPGTFSLERAGALLDDGIKQFVMCPQAVAESGSVNFIIEEVVEFIVSTSWGAVSSAVSSELDAEGNRKTVRNTRVPLHDMELHGALLDFILTVFQTPEIIRSVCEKDCEPLVTSLLNFLWLHGYTHRVLDGTLPGVEHAVEVSASEYEHCSEVSRLVRHRATEVCCILLWNHPRMREMLSTLKEAKSEDGSEPKATGPLHFGPLALHFMDQLKRPLTALLLYTLTHHCPAFQRHLQAETDPNVILIPLLQTLWMHTDESSHPETWEVTVLTLTLFDLLEDSGFQTILNEEVDTSTLEIPGISHVTMPVGSMLVITIVRLAKWNFQTGRDEFFNQLLAGLVGNLRLPLHWYAAQEIVDLLISLGRKLSTKAATQPFAYALCIPIVAFLRRCLAQRHRGAVGFALVRKGHALRGIHASSEQLFSPLVQELDRMESALSHQEDFEFEDAVLALEAMTAPAAPKATKWVYEEQENCRAYFLKICKRGVVGRKSVDARNS